MCAQSAFLPFSLSSEKRTVWTAAFVLCMCMIKKEARALTRAATSHLYVRRHYVSRQEAQKTTVAVTVVVLLPVRRHVGAWVD